MCPQDEIGRIGYEFMDVRDALCQISCFGDGGWMAGDGGWGGDICSKGPGSWVVEGDGRVGYLREAGQGRQPRIGMSALPFCGLLILRP